MLKNQKDLLRFALLCPRDKEFGGRGKARLPLKAVAEEPKIFLIEDDPDIRESVLEVLRTGGFPAEGAASSREALDRLRDLRTKPFLILLDLRMPGEDGFHFRQAQRLDRDLADIPVVLLSADMRVKEMQDELGAIDYLKKPVDIDDLLETVRRNCGGGSFLLGVGEGAGTLSLRSESESDAVLDPNPNPNLNLDPNPNLNPKPNPKPNPNLNQPTGEQSADF